MFQLALVGRNSGGIKGKQFALSGNKIKSKCLPQWFIASAIYINHIGSQVLGPVDPYPLGCRYLCGSGSTGWGNLGGSPERFTNSSTVGCGIIHDFFADILIINILGYIIVGSYPVSDLLDLCTGLGQFRGQQVPADQVVFADAFMSKFKLSFIDDSIEEPGLIGGGYANQSGIAPESPSSHFFKRSDGLRSRTVIDLIHGFGIHQQHIRETDQ